MPLWRRAVRFGAMLAVTGWTALAKPAAEPSPAELPPTSAQSSRKSDWWSLKQLHRPALPTPTYRLARISNPIDAFIVAKLEEKGFCQSPEAGRQILIRRLYFDLLGLPPNPEEIETFVTNSSPLAYEHLVDRLLESPQYGERWARHWLDVVHYGETHGYDKDQPRLNAWPYRDYVIRSLNQDKPYARFIQEQVAGDALFPDTRDGIEALGFIAAGPWDLIGHAEVPETKVDGKVARHLDRDDMVVNTIQTFNSLTVQCAQCHNHKFDPISQEDYYSLQAVFAAVDRADQKYDIDPAVRRSRKSLTGRQQALNSRHQALTEQILNAAGQPLRELDKQISALAGLEKQSAAFGYHSALERDPGSNKWVQVDLGRVCALQSVLLHPCQDNFNGIGEGFGFPARFKVELSDDSSFKNGVVLLGDYTDHDVPNPKLKPWGFEAAGRSARFIRVTVTRLAPRQNDYMFALAELEAIDPNGTNVARGATVSALDSIEAPARWQKSNLTDGWYPGLGSADTTRLAALRKERDDLVSKATSEEERISLADLSRQLDEVKTRLAALPLQSAAYIGAVYQGQGAFAGTGAQGGKPRPIYVLNRGNVQQPGKKASPGALSCMPDLPGRFNLGPQHTESDRRAALARWLTDLGNPLTWRSIVNRVWSYHFGKGLVETPNDFGHMGALPSHPELLDWLAAEFRDGGQSLKHLHRLIVTSATYRQSCAEVEAFAKTDADNRFLWRMNRRKLEAEELRDAMLQLSGTLNSEMGGPGFQDFVIEKPEHSPHYEYSLHDPEDPKCHRRSIYRFIVRSQQQPFLTTLDCADPSMQVGKRNESTSPLQALAMLNNGFVLTMAKHFAQREESASQDLATQVQRAYFEALGHPATAAQLEALLTYAREFGLTDCCRVLFNLNEFAFVD